MNNKTVSFITLAVAAIPTSSFFVRPDGFDHFLAAISILVTHRDENDRWHFRIERNAIGSGQREDILLTWADAVLPEAGIVLGWQLADEIISPLLSATKDADPEVAQAFLNKLTKLLTAASVDLALEHGGEGAPSFSEVLKPHRIPLPALPRDQIETAWTLGQTTRLKAHVEAQAVASWRLWLAEAGPAADDIRAAFNAWLDR